MSLWYQTGNLTVVSFWLGCEVVNRHIRGTIVLLHTQIPEGQWPFALLA